MKLRSYKTDSVIIKDKLYNLKTYDNGETTVMLNGIVCFMVDSKQRAIDILNVE